MKRILLTLAICALLSSSALAGPTVVVYQTGYSSGSGGEFTVLPSGWSWDPLKYYDDSTSNILYTGTFQTFCIEEQETFNPGVTYNVVLNNAAVHGGTATSDPLSVGTAYLYHEFQNQTLADYVWTGAGRTVSAGALQNTIWWLEGETLVDPGAGNVFRNAVIAKFGSAAGAMADNNGQYAVAVLNLYGVDGSLHQDMLVCVPAPGAILLGSIGISLVGWLRRRNTL